MRLINADAFKKDLKAVTLSNGTLVNTNIMLALIDKYPTAYDVDKVIEEFKTDTSVKLYGSLNSGNYMIPIDRAVEIVKQGGVADDVCEWESVSDGEFIQNPHTKRLYSNEPSMKNVYCNTCGKKDNGGGVDEQIIFR